MKRLIQGVHVVGEAVLTAPPPPPPPSQPPAGQSSGDSPSKATATPSSSSERLAADRSMTSPDLSGLGTATESGPLAALLGPKFAVLSMAKAALAALVSWGIDPTLDRICSEALGINRLPPNLALGSRGCAPPHLAHRVPPRSPLIRGPAQRALGSASLRRPRGTLTIHTPGHIPSGTELSVSSAQSAHRLLSMVALTNALRMLPGTPPSSADRRGYEACS